MKLPSDLKILTEIYERYYEQFKNFSREEPTRECKVYVPIDIRAIAAGLETDEYLLFGRLYNHMNKKYEGNEESPLFSMKVGKDGHAIHFPLLASVLAGLKEERNRQNITLYFSFAALIISLFTLGLNGFKTWNETVNSKQPSPPDCVKNQLSQPQVPIQKQQKRVSQ
jgi:hypothetical protein